MKTALTIAGSDPTGGAGLQADIKVFNHFGVYGISAVSALTAQNTYEVNTVLRVNGNFIEEQLNTLISDIRPDAVKTGMLFSVDAVTAVAKIIKGYEIENLVIDPVTISSTGKSLMENGVLDAIKEELFPLARVITPNIYEATAISGVNIMNEKDMETAAKELKKLGPETVVITGGHLKEVSLSDPQSERPSAETRLGRRPVSGSQPAPLRRARTGKSEVRSDREILDLIYDGKKFYRLTGKRIKGEYHGTGCAFSAAIAACLARGTSVLASVKKSQEFIHLAIKNARDIGKGMRLLWLN